VHCRDGAAKFLLPTDSVVCAAQHYVGDEEPQDSFKKEKTLNRIRRPSLTAFKKMPSRNVLNNGRSVGRSVCITKETTLKGIRSL